MMSTPDRAQASEQRQPEPDRKLTMAPNVGLPSSVQGACFMRQDTGYGSLNLPTVSTPADFRSSAPDDICPVRDVGSESDCGSFTGVQSPRNVTFHGVSRKWYRDSRDTSPSSVESGGG